MPLKDSKIFLKLRCLMSIVHIIEVFKTKQIFLQKYKVRIFPIKNTKWITLFQKYEVYDFFLQKYKVFVFSSRSDFSISEGFP